MKNLIDHLDSRKGSPRNSFSLKNIAKHNRDHPGESSPNSQGTHHTTNLSAVELKTEAEETFDNHELFYGEEAKEGFWHLYKSERRFKDYNIGEDDIKDPRFAYLQSCKDLMVYPKARMLIKKEKTNHIDYSNVQLLNKSAVAVAEGIKRYSLPIDEITLSNNGLKTKECQLMIESFSKHYNRIQNLTISKNKLGHEGAKFLGHALQEMKILSKLNLADDEIGDQGINDIVNNCKNYCSLEFLDISGNNLGKSPASAELGETLNNFLSSSRSLEVFKINWNSIRAAVADKVLDGLFSCFGIKEVHFNNNLLGVSYDDKQPPVNRIAELLSKLENLKYLDISFNCVD